ncbi:hypothetical protein [Kluyvera sp. 142486]|uniref:hypothetical protein n=1 Tax=Kluyvera sp. 142486 TaxID=3390050 RepID=UPI003980BC57
MNLYLIDQKGGLALQQGGSVVAEFDNGKMLELAESQQPLPAEIPDGIHIWGGRMPSASSADTAFSTLNIMPVASNGVIISPHHENNSTSGGGIVLFIAKADGALQPVKENKLLIELNNGKTLEVMPDYANKGLLIWGGREPIAGLPLEYTRKRTESLGLFPLAANVVHLFPYRLV